MTKPEGMAYVINLMVDNADGAGVYVRSSDLPGLHLIGRSLVEMKDTVEKAIVRLFRDNHSKAVTVHWLADINSFEDDCVDDIPSQLAITLKAA